MAGRTDGGTVAAVPARDAASPEATATGKHHFEVLDGLRGTAALLVVVFHIQGITVHFEQGRLLLPHAYLAVDFFFALSGFVIGYAYDDRWGRMTLGGFLRLRLVRLHPLVVLGVLLGLTSYLLDPFALGAQDVATGRLLVVLALSLLLLPAPTLPNRWSDTHPLNGPCWTLLQEYVGNIAYALVLRRMSTRALGGLAVASGLVLLGCGLAIGTLDRGYGWDAIWMAPVRLCFPFVAGLWLYRVRDRMPRVRLGYLPLSAIMAGAFALPTLPTVAGISLNGLYEAACVLLLFPLIVAAGAHSDGGAATMRLCRASGQLSYPLYITHFPFLFVWSNFVANAAPAPGVTVAIALLLVPFTLAVAWAAFRFWDVPIRTALRRREPR